MTDREDFLSRWARRKRDARIESTTEAKPEAKAGTITDSANQSQRDQADVARATDNDTSPSQSTAQTHDAQPDDVFDLSKLPSLESIGPATDIRMFMQPGVPEALSRAALRRAWSADPAIRDFIGLAENSWDFTAGDGMHGFGALDPADAKRLLAQLFSESEPKVEDVAEGEVSDIAAQDAAAEAEVPENEATDTTSSGEDGDDAIAGDVVPDPEIATLQRSNADALSVASQQKHAGKSSSLPPLRRSSGRALPQ
jgi:hypothetical protein